MKIVSYAGQQLITTDDVAEALVQLAASVASEGTSEAVQIPILTDGREDCADLIVGVGNDVLVGPRASTAVDPDFSADAARLREHPLFPRSSRTVSHEVEPPFGTWEPDGGFDPATSSH
ncbi:hypothetical protein SRABI76_00759 [Microbacterium oxydans]|uniref:hypothetical protein n=1 Tax=Microbacterium oxydans TaxID=82380 RepID=UPI001DBF35E8|nr:hypothetical protein [Microbacterium oxydans]CAH0149606.1 hypothetical protein SRABI76_00759 [Microbacterium oxydans]